MDLEALEFRGHHAISAEDDPAGSHGKGMANREQGRIDWLKDQGVGLS
jgi:hypothetical protein